MSGKFVYQEKKPLYHVLWRFQHYLDHNTAIAHVSFSEKAIAQCSNACGPYSPSPTWLSGERVVLMTWWL